MLHGAGSSPEFVQRAFAARTAELGWELVAPDVRGSTMAEMLLAIQQAGPDVIGGVSLGAHAAAAYAAQWDGPVYAVMPAWIGQPEAVAGLTRHTADEIAELGVTAVLRRLRALGDDWIVRELERAWTVRPQIADDLRVAAGQPAPAPAALGRITGPVTIVALADDPTHPLAVAQQWADSIPHAQLHVLPRDLGDRAPQALADFLGHSE